GRGGAPRTPPGRPAGRRWRGIGVVTHAHARLSALVDGELDNDSRERILAHLTHCEECRVAADEERRIKALLSGMPAPPAADDLNAFLVGLGAGDLSDDLTDDMAGAPSGSASHGLGLATSRRRGASPRTPLTVGGTTFARRPPSRARTLGPRRRLFARTQAGLPRQLPRALQNLQGPTSRTSRPLAGRPAGRPPVGPLGGHFGRRAVVGVAGLAAMAGMAVVAAFAAGGSGGGAQVTVVPPVQQYSVDHANSVSNLPLSDPGAVTAVLERGRSARTTGR
ncbi:MAG TPA: anti-sigma factor, partial [Actinopolymorphaceae bacterium]|nr:anti-sigma factor [Actinopolymorphaceae bacterium]